MGQKPCLIAELIAHCFVQTNWRHEKLQKKTLLMCLSYIAWEKPHTNLGF